MTDWLQQLSVHLETGPVAVVTVLVARGSVPREVGARMLVTRDRLIGTIGGGALEHAAMAHARGHLLSALTPWARDVLELHLGPALQQCCGGFVRLVCEVFLPDQRTEIEAWRRSGGILWRSTSTGTPIRHCADRHTRASLPMPIARVAHSMLAGTGPRGTAIVGIDPAWIVEPVLAPASRLFLYGAGHVGRAVVHALSGLDFSIDWIDVAADRFPTAIPAGVSPIVAADPVAMARGAPAGAFHVVMTFSHALDEAIVAALLARGDFAYLGLIGSRTKRARFVQRLLRAGISDSVIARLVCPIGGTGVAGKTPARIALSLALELVRERDRLSDADVHRASG